MNKAKMRQASRNSANGKSKTQFSRTLKNMKNRLKRCLTINPKDSKASDKLTALNTGEWRKSGKSKMVTG